MKPGPGPLTASDFYKFLKCPNWVYWDLFGDPNDKGEVSEMMKKLREDGVLHEKDVIKRLGPFEEMPSEGPAEARFAVTLAAMKAGVPLIYQGTLMDDGWTGRPDLLRRVFGRSNFGGWAYEAVDIKSSREIHDAQKYQLVFYALLLKKIQGVKPDEGKIINVDNQERSFPIEEAESDFFDILDRILAIRAGEKPEALFMSSCKDSPWYELCKKEAEANDDISLIYKIYKKEYRHLREAGYATLSLLAAADPEALSREVKGVSDHRLERLRLQAASLCRKNVVWTAEPSLPDAGTELFFDIEGDPLLGVEYLFGLLVREGGKTEYKMFLAEKPEDEGQAWLEFCDFIEAFEGTPIYHYGWYELEVIRRLSAKHGISKKAGRALDGRNMIDLVRVVQNSVILPLYFYSLKDVARHLGFSWRAKDASGANSVLWFQEWLESGNRAVLQKIIDYNEDDVRATLFLKDWLVKGK